MKKSDLTAGMPPTPDISAEDVQRARAGGARQLVVLDDDPTGTQSVAELPVLNSWEEEDLRWALETEAPAVYVMTNSRSLPPEQAAERNREVVRASLAAASSLGREVDFVSRGDSTLRGHYPLEPATIIETLAEADIAIDGVILLPAFGDAGRITVGGIHYAGNDADGFVPVGETEFARDATFGYKSSDLREWVEEKTEGAITAEDVAVVDLTTLRSEPEKTAAILAGLSNGQPAAADIVEEADIRALALALLAAQKEGKRFVYRVGPPFVRAMIGQPIVEPLTAEDVSSIRSEESVNGGLIVVGSHVALTTRQLNNLRERRTPREFVIEVTKVLSDERHAHLEEIVANVAEALREGNAVVSTSRTLVKGVDGEDSLRIAREVSDAVVAVVRKVLDIAPPRFVIAKGGITSSDVASRGLEIGRAVVRGPMLPGIVSLWEPIMGPAQGIPYIVFAGNVGNDQSLADVVDKLSQ